MPRSVASPWLSSTHGPRSPSTRQLKLDPLLLICIAPLSRLLVVARHAQGIDLTAVHVNCGSVQPATVRRDREGDETADIARCAEPRDVELAAVMLLGGRFVEAGPLHDDAEPVTQAVGLDRAGIDGEHLNAVALAELGQRLHEGEAGAD